MTLQLKDFPGFNNVENNTRLGTAIAQWIRLRLPSCRPKHTIYALKNNLQ